MFLETRRILYDVHIVVNAVIYIKLIMWQHVNIFRTYRFILQSCVPKIISFQMIVSLYCFISYYNSLQFNYTGFCSNARSTRYLYPHYKGSSCTFHFHKLCWNGERLENYYWDLKWNEPLKLNRIVDLQINSKKHVIRERKYF